MILQFCQLTGLVVKGLVPGQTTIYASANNVIGTEVFKISVRVLRPIELRFNPSSEFAIQTGYVILNLILVTDGGEFSPKFTRWVFPQGVLYTQINSSSVFLNCLESGDFRIKVESYDLSSVYSLQVEPLLKILSPKVIRLPPNGNYQVQVEGSLHCNLKTIEDPNKSILKITESTIYVNDKNGEIVVNVIFEHQVETIVVIVSTPSFLHIVIHSPTQIQLLLCDSYSLQYTSYNGVSQSLQSLLDDAKFPIPDHQGYINTFSQTDKAMSLRAVASNQAFSVETTLFLEKSIFNCSKITKHH